MDIKDMNGISVNVNAIAKIYIQEDDIVLELGVKYY